MRRLVYIFAILSIIMSACSAPATLTPTPQSVVTEAPVLTDTPTPTKPPVATVTATATEPAVPTTNVTCYELSLFLDPALASSATCELIPASTLEADIHPEYTRLNLEGYPDQYLPATISIFPVQKYEELLPDYLPGQLTELQALISGDYPGDSVLPFLPLSYVGDYFALYQVVPFMNGSGIFYLPLGKTDDYYNHSIFYAPVNNHDLFYTYQSLTADGEYWISAILPINHAILPTDEDQPGGESYDLYRYKSIILQNNFSATIQAKFISAQITPGSGTLVSMPPGEYEAIEKQKKIDFGFYIATLSTQLENQPPGSFRPSLTALEDLIASIIIQP